MAKVRLNALTTHLSGRVGNVVFKQYGDKPVVTRVPHHDKNRVPSADELAGRRRLAAATRYASEVLRDPVRRAQYAPLAKKRRRSIQIVAISDYLQRHPIQQFHAAASGARNADTAGGHVTSVRVHVCDSHGRQIESDRATRDGAHWRYVRTRPWPDDATVTIEATISATARRAAKISVVLPTK